MEREMEKIKVEERGSFLQIKGSRKQKRVRGIKSENGGKRRKGRKMLYEGKSEIELNKNENK